MDRHSHCCGLSAGLLPARLWCAETLGQAIHSQVSGYYCTGQRNKTQKRAGKMLSYGELEAGYSPLGMYFKSTRKKWHYGEQGKIELGHLINYFLLIYRDPEFSLVLYRNKPEKLFQTGILWLDYQNAFSEVPFWSQCANSVREQFLRRGLITC